ncbi:MAG: RluA family pseudouridine synthase [Spirochaetota bacterium]
MSTEKIELCVSAENTGIRLDQFLSSAPQLQLSRSYIQKLVKNGNVSVNGKDAKSNLKLRENDRVDLTIPEPEAAEIEPCDIPLEILYEDDAIAVINKQPGISVHQGAGIHGPTLVNALMYHLDGLSSIGGVERPGIVHRLDKDTAGLMVIAKNDLAHRSMSEKFQERTVSKEYAAVTFGIPARNHIIIEKNIGRHSVYRQKMTVRDDGRYAKTELILTKTWAVKEGSFSLFRVILHTGRTHQIRVHCAAEGLPIVGDPLYAKKNPPWETPFLLLASVRLAFDHPITGKAMDFTVSLPGHIQQFIDKLESIR